MNFSVNKEIFSICDNLYIGVIVANNIDIKTNYPANVENFDQCLKNKELYYELMSKFSINYKKYPPSFLSLSSRISNNKLPNISPTINLANSISVKYGVPVGVHDIDSLYDDLELKCYDNKEIAYVCSDTIRTSNWIYRQTSEGKISNNADNLIFLVDGSTDNISDIENACEELENKLNTIFNAKTRMYFISNKNRSVNIGDLTNEEIQLENTLAMILKGVEVHSSIQDIRQKLSEAILKKKQLNFKLGLDPTAPDVHLGHAVVLRKIKQMQDLGHIATIVIGDYTARIGDPTGKSKTRKPLSESEILSNAKTYTDQIFKIIDSKKTRIVYNSEWLSKLQFHEVLNLASKCTVARMLERDDFENRYKNHSPIYIHEFFYPLMQGYDSVAINADIELGGTDQTFNVLMGRNLQKDYGQDPQLVLLMPILEGIDGIEKMSKSLGNYIGINETAYDIYQKVMKIPDSLIIKYYNLCTDLEPNYIEKIQSRLLSNENPRDIKMELAFEIAKLYHSESDAANAQQKFINVFQKGQIPLDITEIVIDKESNLDCAEQIFNYLIINKIFKSRSDIRRLIIQGAVKYNDKKIQNINQLNITIVNSGILQIGKKNKFKITL